ncbi:hypothetical protein BV22DRAFT_1108213 [Leucogyrophana mollusca]|uniref:Uncharacterized protein n=1 Tax=Leucogyrophana mollusca TaxID=85980 RepID=A0ACB8B036_9AGAM|nr:hypothetical protein BV22DRAFT_1108213 [Leucogyrophana mollusca]
MEKKTPNAEVEYGLEKMSPETRLTTNLKKWENNGWINIKNSELFQKVAHLLRKRAAQMSFRWIKGHNGTIGNEEADKLANEGAKKNRPDLPNLEIPIEFKIEGAKLETLDQATAHAINQINKEWETDKSIWLACRHQDLTNQTPFKIGDYWNNIPNYEQRARCQACRDTNESMEHILLECPQNAQKLIWKMTKELWPSTNTTWPQLSIGTILGCGSLTLKKPTPQRNNNPNKKQTLQKILLRILISKSAYLIWTLRCNNIINGINLPPTSIRQKWHSTINKRLIIDRINQRNPKRTKIPAKIAQHTWTGTIENKKSLPYDWISNKEVLVGIKPPRPSRE